MTENIDGKKVAFLLTDGFEDSELTSPWAAVTEAVVKMLAGLLESSGPRIRGAALQALRRLGESAKAAESVVSSLAEHDPETRVQVAARAALKAMQTAKSSSAELDRLRGELDSLKKRNQDLADRLKKLEAK